MKMGTLHIIYAYDGTMVLDSTPTANIRIAAMDYIEARYRRERKREVQRQRELAKKPLWRVAAFCGIV